MKSFSANWKTSGAGILMIALGVLSATGKAPVGVGGDPMTLIMGGLGLLFAKDGNVTGGDVKQ